MNENRNYFQSEVPELTQLDSATVNEFMARVFGWMFVGLLVTTLTTVGIVYGLNFGSYAFANFVLTVLDMWFVVLIAQVGLVFFLSARITRLQPGTAKLLYLVYAMTNGFTIGLVSIIIATNLAGGIQTLGLAFGITTVTFGVMAFYGYTTKADLTRFSSLFRFALFGLIIAIVANMFMGSDMIDFLICVVGLFIFIGLVAADTNKIKNHFALAAVHAEPTEYETLEDTQARLSSNLAIVGALMLYLDFINMFMFILRLLARRN